MDNATSLNLSDLNKTDISVRIEFRCKTKEMVAGFYPYLVQSEEKELQKLFERRYEVILFDVD